MPPLLTLLATRPQLLVEHADAYGALLASEIGRWSALWQRRALMHALAWSGVVVAVLLAGMALMLWSTLPAVPGQAAWVLFGVPLIPLLAALGCVMAAPRPAPGAFDTIRQQVDADLALLRQLGAA